MHCQLWFETLICLWVLICLWMKFVYSYPSINYFVSSRSWSLFVMDNLFKVALRSQTIFSGFLFVVSVISWPFVIDLLRDYHGKDRFNFNCVPKPNDLTRQRCYDNYTSTTSPLLTPLDFAGITYMVCQHLSGCFLPLWGLQYCEGSIRRQTERRRKKWRHIFIVCSFVTFAFNVPFLLSWWVCSVITRHSLFLLSICALWQTQHSLHPAKWPLTLDATTCDTKRNQKWTLLSLWSWQFPFYSVCWPLFM